MYSSMPAWTLLNLKNNLRKALEKKKDEYLKNKILKEQYEDHTKQLLSEVNSNASLL